MAQSKLPDVGTTIFATMSKMATDHQAINLSQGFPDFPVSEELISLVNKHMKQGNNQYAPMPGVPTLRNEIATYLSSRYNYRADPNLEITITSGATEGLFATINALIKQDDEVIILDPAYDSYDPAIVLAGGTPIHVELEASTFSIDWEKLSGAITAKTKMLIINTPHNPSGSIITKDEMLQVQKLAEENNLYILSDEVYEHIIFDKEKHQSVLLYPELAKRSIAAYSFGKTFHATGWKVGYLVAPAEIMAEIRKVHQYLTYSVSTPVQYAIAEYLKQPEHYTDLGLFYQKKRDFFVDRIQTSPFEILPCRGTYFQLLSYKGISDKSDLSMAEHLTKELGIASIPISVFYKEKTDNRILRFCFAKKNETLEQAAEILCKI